MASAIFGALRYLPAKLARQALVKVNPKFNNYFTNALAYGVDTNRALDFLLDRFESDAQKNYKNSLEQGAAANTLRPDEAVSRSEMNNSAIPGKILKGAASLALGAGLPSLEGGSNSRNQSPRVEILKPEKKPLQISSENRAQLTKQDLPEVINLPQQARKYPEIKDAKMGKSEALQAALKKIKSKKQPSELSREVLQEQFKEAYRETAMSDDARSKEALRRTIQEGMDLLRKLKGE